MLYIQRFFENRNQIILPPVRERSPGPRGQALIALALWACAVDKEPAGPDTAPVDSAPDEVVPPGESARGLAQLEGLGVRNLIVLHVDTLRADALVAYGATRQTAPNLHGAPYLAVRGARASAPWTLPSTTTALTGLGPERHGNVATVDGASNEVATTLAERLDEVGYLTLMMGGNRVVDDDPLLARGFDEIYTVSDIEDVPSQSLAALWETSRALLEASPEAPFFVWLQPMDTHAPYRPEDEWLEAFGPDDDLPFAYEDDGLSQEQAFAAAYEAATTDEERAALVRAVRDVYDALVRQQDATTGEILAWLAANGHQDDTLVVLSSDHGETIADDGTATLNHLDTVRPELVDLPLIFVHPGLDSAATDCLHGNASLGPTLLDVLGLEPLEGVDGGSLLDGCETFAFTSLWVNDLDEDSLRWVSAMDQGWRLDWDCEAGAARLYDLSSDPLALDEVEDGATEAVYQSALEGWLASARAVEPDLRCGSFGAR